MYANGMGKKLAAPRNNGGREQGEINWKLFLALVGLMIVIGLLWNTFLVQPLRILVVFFHELSHGVAALLTGGKIIQIRIIEGEGGLCLTMGGSRFLILSAGYLGSLLWGGGLLLIATRTRWDRQACMVLGILMALVTLLWVRPVISFGFMFTALVSAGLIFAAVKLHEDICDFILKLIGLVSILYVPQDIFSDVLSRSYLPSDARMLYELTGLHTVFWGTIWVLISLWLGFYFITQASRTGAESRPAKRKNLAMEPLSFDK